MGTIHRKADKITTYFFSCQLIFRSDYMQENEWLICPFCKNKTRVKIRTDTIIQNLPLFCPKCKHETLVSVEKLQIKIIHELDAQTQSR